MIAYRKVHYPISDPFRFYLKRYGRESPVPDIYDDLRRFSGAVPYEDPRGNETLWQTVMFPPHEMAELTPKLTQIYVHLKMGHDLAATEHLAVERIDFGEFGNSKPFRIRIVNRFNDNFDHYYVKKADASRIYGLELEHILSPNRINFLVNAQTLIEEHIAGLPGDRFIREYLVRSNINRVRIAKEFVKFNQRCFIRLLGDMRSVNYVVDITPDFEETQYRVRPIDFDQQSYEGARKVYLAQYFADNRPVVEMVEAELNRTTILQYQAEERTVIARRRRVAATRFTALMDLMRTEELAPEENVGQLRAELAEFHRTEVFDDCRSMGDLVATHLDVMLELPT